VTVPLVAPPSSAPPWLAASGSLRDCSSRDVQATRVAHELNLLANRYQATQPREAAELRQAARAYLAAAMSR